MTEMKLNITRCLDNYSVLVPLFITAVSIIGGWYPKVFIIITIILFGIFTLIRQKHYYELVVPNVYIRDFTIIALIYFFVSYYASRHSLTNIFHYEYLAILFKFIFGPIVLFISAYSRWEKIIFSKIFYIIFLINIFLIFSIFNTGVSTGLVFGSLHSNQIGAFGFMTFCIGLLAYTFGNKSFIWWLLIPLAIFVIIISLSRAAAIASIVGLLFYYFRRLLFNLKFFRNLAVGLVVVILCVIPFKLDLILKSNILNPAVTIIENATNKAVTDNGRIKLWSYSTSLITESPIYGHGVDARRSWNKTLSNGDEITMSPHNLYISIILEAGFLGMALVFLLLLRVFSLLSLYKTSISGLGLPILVGILFHQVFETSLTTGSVLMGGYMWFTLGAIIRLSYFQQTNKF